MKKQLSIFIFIILVSFSLACSQEITEQKADKRGVFYKVIGNGKRCVFTKDELNIWPKRLKENPTMVLSDNYNYLEGGDVFKMYPDEVERVYSEISNKYYDYARIEIIKVANPDRTMIPEKNRVYYCTNEVKRLTGAFVKIEYQENN